MKKKLIIHIGFPKTATTSLQLNLFGDLHHDGKIEYLNHLNRKENYLGNIGVKNIVNFITRNVKNSEVEYEVENLKKLDSGIYLISSENISFFYENFVWGYSSEKTLDNFNRTKEILSEVFDEIEILMGIRAHISLIPSYYRQQYQHIVVENPTFKKFDYWLYKSLSKNNSNSDILFLNYSLVYRKIIELFGKENVQLILFEDLKKDSDEFYHQLGSIFKVPTDYVRDSLSSKKNNVGEKESGGYITSQPTIKQKYIGPIRLVVKTFIPKGLFKLGAKYFNRLIPNQLINKKTGQRVVLNEVSEEQIQKIYLAYQESNLELMNLSGLDYEKLKNYKYI